MVKIQDTMPAKQGIEMVKINLNVPVETFRALREVKELYKQKTGINLKYPQLIAGLLHKEKLNLQGNDTNDKNKT